MNVHFTPEQIARRYENLEKASVSLEKASRQVKEVHDRVREIVLMCDDITNRPNLKCLYADTLDPEIDFDGRYFKVHIRKCVDPDDDPSDRPRDAAGPIVVPIEYLNMSDYEVKRRVCDMHNTHMRIKKEQARQREIERARQEDTPEWREYQRLLKKFGAP